MLLNLIDSEKSEVKYDTSIFPGGEIYFKVKNYYEVWNRGITLTIKTRLNSSHDIMLLILAVDALRILGCKTIDCLIPYIPYGRQDRVCNIGESFSIKVLANIINGLEFREIITLDTHSDVTPALIDRLTICSSDILEQYHITNHEEHSFNILVPDAGSGKRCHHTATRYLRRYPGSTINLIQCNKIRDLETTKILKTEVPVINNNLPTYIVDDICDGGRTFIEIAKKFRENNQNDLYLVVSHGIFSSGEEELAKYFKKIYTTNSIKEQEDSQLIERLKVI